MVHFIRQQYLHVDLKGSESDGFALQNHLTDLYYSKLLPAIEKVFDKFSTSDGHIKIDRINIDAGSISLAEFEVKLEKAVTIALMEHLEKETQLNVSDGNKNNPEAQYLKSTEEDLWGVFGYFLHYGSLPWYYRLPTGKILEEVIADLLMNDESGNRIPLEKITGTLVFPLAAKRLVLQFSEAFILILLKKISHGNLYILDKLNRVSGKVITNPEDAQMVRRMILEKIIILKSSADIVPEVEIARQVLLGLKSEVDLFLSAVKYFKQVWPGIKIDDQKPVPKEKQLIKRLSGKELIRENLSSEDLSGEELTRGIYIDNAGLVLIHPFLPRFFEALGITDDAEIIKPERALGLLHYLATGETGMPEYELVLPKILCQVPLITPVPADIGIKENEVSESSALLDAVIKHWEALRNTSQDELRGTFLLRPGKLSQKDDGDWLLQVESRTYDVLLDHLPWGISMIKLPWMKGMLWVEWR